jgi:arylsulfatase A-like enzyme
VAALYDAEVRDADAALGEALADLERMGLAERTALIVLGDHGQELGERGDFGAGEGLYEESLAVPLLVVPPGWNRARESGERLDAPVSLLDVHPTALALGGVAGGPELQGRSLLNDASDDGSPVLLQASVPGRRRSLRLGAYKLIVSPVGAPELYDLAGDRAERDNLWSARPLLQRTLRHVFSLAAAYETAWSRPRWGDAYRVRAAFAADLGP